MSEVAWLSLLFVGVGALFVGVGVPLLQGRVPPNDWYGCRTSKTLSDEKIWYAANRVTGQDMVIAGVFVVFSSLVMFAFGRGMNPDLAAAVLVAVTLLSVAGMAFHGFKLLRRM